MPIRPEDRDRYPANWSAISAHIRFTRAGSRCECAGQCATGHKGRCHARHNRPHPTTGSTVVLTVAHLDQTPENCAADNLAAMCQRCHLAYDATQHADTARRTRFAQSVVGMEPLFVLDGEKATPPENGIDGVHGRSW
jgi:hypothetical protein